MTETSLPPSIDPQAIDLLTPDPAQVTAQISAAIADELGVQAWQSRAAIELLDGGSTVPFIARYRKEVTGTLDDAQLRDLEERLRYLRELEDRRRAVLESISAQGKLTEELAADILAADTKARLEDLYLPYKSKRKTRAQIAREAGLEPLADALIADPTLAPTEIAAGYLNPEQNVPTTVEALAGARAILIERVGQDVDLVERLRERLWSTGLFRSRVKEGKESEGAKFADYFDFSQCPSDLPSHRVLALLRAEKEGVVELDLTEADPADEEAHAVVRGSYERAVAGSLGVDDQGRAADGWLTQTAQLAWRVRILGRLSVDLRGRMFAAAEEEAVRVFAANLRDVLLAAPAGNKTTMGLDPGLRTGVKVAVVDGTGKVVTTDTIHPHAPANRWDRALATLATLVREHTVDLIAIGNGTASRETDRLAAELVSMIKKDTGRHLDKIVVSESGASIYSASALASAELPDMDVSLRGAVSIARRLQDPLAELVKIDPKSIGVGQYQHDVTPGRLDRSLDAVVEDCVNSVGVDVNTASPALLSRVAGVGSVLSERIVAHRDANGPFGSRRDLRGVPRLGDKAFEQCAGFLRITGGSDPLDGSSVHPESYALARKIMDASKHTTALDPRTFVDDRFGLPTVRDIIAELEKPGRDPRPEFKAASLADGVEKISDLTPGMILEGTVSNVAAFGAFVDVGVHQDGLVHISAMSDRFVSDPREVVRSGQVVTVKVISADPERKRIALTLRLDDEVTTGDAGPAKTDGRGQGRKRRRDRPSTGSGREGTGSGREGTNSAMADALRKAGLK